MARLRRKLTYSNVISTLCLFLLLGGGAWAAVNLPKHSVGPKQLRKNAVRSWKVKNRSLRRSDLAPGVLPAGLGDAGTGAYSNGISRDNGDDVDFGYEPKAIVSLNLPAGSYLITVTASIFNYWPDHDTYMYCVLDYDQAADADVDGQYFAPREGHNESIAQAVQLESSDTVQYDCSTSAHFVPLTVDHAHMTAVDVGSIEQQP